MSLTCWPAQCGPTNKRLMRGALHPGGTAGLVILSAVADCNLNVTFQNRSSERIQITQRVTKTILFPVFKWVCTQAWYRFGFIRSSCRIIFSIKETSSIQYPLSTRLCYNIYIKSGIWRKDTHVICTVKLLILQKD